MKMAGTTFEQCTVQAPAVLSFGPGDAVRQRAARPQVRTLGGPHPEQQGLLPAPRTRAWDWGVR